MSVADYLSLLDWTARQVRSDKQGATPQHLAPIFDRLGVSSEVWCHLVKHFGKLFSIVAGQPNQIDGHRSKSNTHRYRARRTARELLSSVEACPGPAASNAVSLAVERAMITAGGFMLRATPLAHPNAGRFSR